MKSKGLGDTIEKITKATGVKSLVEYITTDILKMKEEDLLSLTNDSQPLLSFNFHTLLLYDSKL